MQPYRLGRHGRHLWMRDLGRRARGEVEQLLDQSSSGDVVVIDMADVEAFDFSFASEFFGRLLQRIPMEYPGRFIVVENLGPWARENLAAALDGLGLAIMVNDGDRFDLIGKIAETDRVTFAALVTSGGVATAPELADQLKVNLTAMNERLGKLVRAGLIRRAEAPGRTRFTYSAPL